MVEVGSVSVVIPSIGRASLESAIRSALLQGPLVREVLVVFDSSPPHRLGVLDPRLRTLSVGPRAGGNVARQEGVLASTGKFIALLDDDDEWLPDHISDLMTLAGGLSSSSWIASSRTLVENPDSADEVWPARLMGADENLIEYLVRKQRLQGGIGFIQASSLLFPRQLAIDVPFDGTQRFHQDLHWLVSVYRAKPGLKVLQAKRPSSLYRVTAGSVSGRISSRETVRWGIENLVGASKRARGDFILVSGMQGVRRSSSMRDARFVFAQAVREGVPGCPALAYGASIVVMAGFSRVRRQVTRFAHWLSLGLGRRAT